MDSFVEKCQTVCKLLYQSLRIPIYVYQGDSLMYTSVTEPSAKLPPLYVRQLLLQKYPVLHTNYGACFGRLDYVKDNHLHLIMGPITTLQPEYSTLFDMYRDYAVLPEQREVFKAFHMQIPTMTYLDFYHHLICAYYMLNDKVLTLTDLIPEPTKEETVQTRQSQVARMYQQKEEQTYNNSMELEEVLLTIVKTGNVTAIQEFINSVPRYQAGVVADTPVRLQKNYFITTISLATRAAITGGLLKEQAYRLSDLYIAKVETLSDVQSINTLYMQALNDLTVQVNAAQQAQRQLVLQGTNQIVQSCMDYVQKHTHSPLTVQALADALGYHRSYLSSVFAKTTGIHLNDYIYRCKLEESKHLLLYSAKKIGEISDALCFSNQSHFVQRFKKLYGMTPAEYRLSQ